MKFDPPRLTQGPLSGRIFVVTHGKIRGEHGGREIIEASVKYDVTDQFNALVEAQIAGPPHLGGTEASHD